MSEKLFWEKKTLKKYRIIFETSEIIVGADRKNKYRTFRKDTGVIAFSRREVLEMKLNDLTHKNEAETENNEKDKFARLNDTAFGFNFG